MPPPNSSPHVRLATPDDAETIHRFIEELADYEREPDAVEVTPSTLAAQLRQTPPPFECLLAVDGERPLGMALFFHTYSTWRGRQGIHLEDLWVTPAARRQGVGRMLMAGLARTAKARDCARLEWSVLDWNELALDFYRGLGATGMDGWTTWRLDGDRLEALASTA